MINWERIEKTYPIAHEDIKAFFLLYSSPLITDEMMERRYPRSTMLRYKKILKDNLKL